MELRDIAIEQIAHPYIARNHSGVDSREWARSTLEQATELAAKVGNEGAGAIITMLARHGVTPHVAEALVPKLVRAT